MAHLSRTNAAAKKRKLTVIRNQKIDRLHRLLCEAFPEYWTHIGDQFVVGVKEKENTVIVGVRGMWIDRHNLRRLPPVEDVYGIRGGAPLPDRGPPANLMERVVNAKGKPVHTVLKEIYATLPDPAKGKVEVRVGGTMPVHPRRQKIMLMLNAIESAFPQLKGAPGYGSSAVAGGRAYGESVDNSLLIDVDGPITLDDLERACRTPGKLHVRLKDVCDTMGIEGHEDEPLSPIHLKVNNQRRTVTYASLFEGEGHG